MYNVNTALEWKFKNEVTKSQFTNRPPAWMSTRHGIGFVISVLWRIFRKFLCACLFQRHFRPAVSYQHGANLKKGPRIPHHDHVPHQKNNVYACYDNVFFNYFIRLWRETILQPSLLKKHYIFVPHRKCRERVAVGGCWVDGWNIKVPDFDISVQASHPEPWFCVEPRITIIT